MQETNQTQISEELKDSLVTATKEVESEKIKTSENTTTVQLPSNGLINPRIKEVTLRRMTVKESKTLYTSNDPNYLATLVTGCIIEPVNISTKDLHPNDVIYLTYILRYISTPKNLEQQVACTNPQCRKIFKTSVDIPNLKVNYATPDKYDFSVKLPDCKDRLKFRILSEYDIVNCEKISTRKVKQEDIQDSEWYLLISKIAYMLTEINDEPIEEHSKKIEYLENLSAYDFESFNKAYNEITKSFGINRKFYTECPHCKDAVEVEAYIAPDFFQLV